MNIKARPKYHVKRLVISFLIVALVLINPIPVIVSASEETITNVTNTLNIPGPDPSDVNINKNTSIDIGNIKKYLTVESAFLGLADNVSIYFKDLNSGQEFSTLPDKSWIPASIIKAYVAADAFEQRRDGLIDFNSQVTIVADNVVANALETDDFPRLREGTQVTIGQLVQAMIVQSDNTAYNTLLDILDRRKVMSYIKSLGINDTVVGEKLNVDDNQERRDSNTPGYQFNVTTAGDYEKLFDALYKNKIPDSEELLAIFKRQKLNSMIPAMIPSTTVIAHKTGEWAPIYHDGGIVYKDGNPFILALFSNSNNPQELAKLSEVAYYQDSNHVDTNFSNQISKKSNNVSSIDKISLADSDSVSKVLAATTLVDSSAVTATDLGITPEDLGVNGGKFSDVPYTLITPASPLYKIKIFIENFRMSNASPAQKPALALSFAKERLSELKSVSGVPNESYMNSINNSFEDNIKNVAKLSESSQNKNTLLLTAKQLNDTHFVVMGKTASNVSSPSKDKFIDVAYQSITKNQQEIAPIVKNSPLAVASKIEPIVGTVNSVENGIASLTLDNGKKTNVVLPDSVNVRSFGQSQKSDASSIVTGQKIAVVGVSEPDGKISPVFIMKDVPKVIPKTQGVILEINPGSNTIKIENSKGQIENVQVNSNTVIKAKDTGVSLEGIKAGSVVTIVGDSSNPATPYATSTPVLSTKPYVSPTPGLINITTINAQSVTINVNGSGKDETVKIKQTKPASASTVKNNPAPSKVQTPKPTVEDKSTPKPAVTPVSTPAKK